MREMARSGGKFLIREFDLQDQAALVGYSVIFLTLPTNRCNCNY